CSGGNLPKSSPVGRVQGHSHSLKPPKAVLFGRLPAASAPALGPSPTSLADERREQRSAESPQAACEPLPQALRFARRDTPRGKNARRRSEPRALLGGAWPISKPAPWVRRA